MIRILEPVLKLDTIVCNIHNKYKIVLYYALVSKVIIQTVREASCIESLNTICYR